MEILYKKENYILAKKVFIDPGHGGNDSGAVGINNLLENDITLFEACDRSCAVGNAHKAVKERADYILETNLNAGGVKFLEKEMK